MAMNGAALGARIVDIIIAQSDEPVSPAARAGMLAMWTPIGVEIINEVRKAQILIPNAQPGLIPLPGSIIA